MSNFEKMKEEKTQLLNSVMSEIETREKAIAQINREKQSLETQGLVIQGAIAMLDELIANEDKEKAVIAEE